MNDDDESPSFADQIRGVRPLRGRRALPPVGPAATREARTPAGPEVAADPEDPSRGRAPDVSRRELARLAAGEIPVERELDLHGLTRPEAQRETRRTVETARADGLRCVALVHGRGRHSEAGPVLAEALPDWLCTPPLAGAILAFAPAPARAGGSGVTLVLLRRAAGGAGTLRDPVDGASEPS
ncbi:MAG: Smr/MutS family protein [Proteobacteria bacterium]|nr:Smr/MutS family protein [Pseudomonadota bacterium]